MFVRVYTMYNISFNAEDIWIGDKHKESYMRQN